MLIELKDPKSGNVELFDSIWATVEKANTLSLHKNQLMRDYIAFTDPEKPFIRTDKRTIKRRDTLALYANYIEQFYDSRLADEEVQFLVIDTSSLESTTRAIRHLLASLVPEIKDASLDADIFRLGFDSLLVFRAIKSIGAATGLKGRLTSRHLYASPNINGFAATVLRLVAEGKAMTANGVPSAGESENPEIAKMRNLMAQHKSRLSAKVNPCDLMNPNIYVGMKFYIPLREEVSFEQAYRRLQEGLCRTMELIPELGGKVMRCSEHEMGYKKGDLRITLPPLPSTATAHLEGAGSSQEPRQLRFKDLSTVLPSFEEQRATGFLSSAYRDEVFTGCPWFPTLPADVLYAQANFVKGGCILAFNLHHAAFDGAGVIIALRVWAECCRYLEGDTSATCSWLDPESLNRNLLSVLYELEGFAKPANKVDPNVWGFLGFPDPAELHNGINEYQPVQIVAPPIKSSLPTAPPFPRKFAWPPTPPADGRQMTSSTFLLSAENVERLRQSVLADPEAKGPVGAVTSISDIVQAFFWRAAIKARYRVAQELRGESFARDDISIVEMPIDARPYFSSLLPSSYMGSCLVTNRPYMPVVELCASDTSLGRIAYLFREAATHITPSLVHDAFTLLQSIPDYSMLTNACMGLGSMHLMMNNLILFQTSDISFGGEFFAHNGVPDTVRIQMDRFNTAFRLLLIHPMREDGGVELLLGTLPEEFDMLITDKQFMQYAEFMG